MTPIPSNQASAELSHLIEQVTQSHEPIQILGEGAAAVLVAEEDWRAIQETLHLLSIPGMRDSIREGLQTPLSECAEEPGW